MGLGSKKSPRQSAPDFFQLAARSQCMKGVLGFSHALLIEVNGADVSMLKISHSGEGIITSTPGKMFHFVRHPQRPKPLPKFQLGIKGKATSLTTIVQGNQHLVGTFN